MRIFAIMSLFILTGCTIIPNFNHRLNYNVITSTKAIQRLDAGPVQIEWAPINFPQRIDVQGAAGFVAHAAQIHIPIGAAISTRVIESLDTAIGVIPGSAKKVKINVINAKTEFTLTSGMIDPSTISNANCVFEAEFTYENKSWSAKFNSDSKDLRIEGNAIEKVWDDISFQVCKDIVNHLVLTPPPTLPKS